MGCVQSQQENKETRQTSQQQQQETHSLPKEYTAERYTQLLHSALQSGDASLVLKALQECSPDQQVEVAAQFASKYNQELYEACNNSNLGKTEAFAANLLLRTSNQVLASYLCNLLGCDIVREKTVIELLLTRKDDEFSQIQNVYDDSGDRKLVEDLRVKCRGDVGDLLASRLEYRAKAAGDSQQRDDAGDQSAETYAAELIEGATSGQLFEGRRLFHHCMTTLALGKLKDVLESFLKKCQRDISVEIEKYYPDGSAKEGLRLMAGVVRNPWLHLAERVHELLKKEDAESRQELLAIVLLQDEEQLRMLKQCYKSTFFEMLARDVREEVHDENIQRFLLKAVK